MACLATAELRAATATAELRYATATAELQAASGAASIRCVSLHDGIVVTELLEPVLLDGDLILVAS
jgi:hypothetical protein